MATGRGRPRSYAPSDDEERPDHPLPPGASGGAENHTHRRRSRNNYYYHSRSGFYGSNPHIPTLETPIPETDEEAEAVSVFTEDEQSDHPPPTPTPDYVREQRHVGRSKITPMTRAMPSTRFMESHSSYHGPISGEEAARRLQRANDDYYLCRFSRNYGYYVLTVIKRHPDTRVGQFRLVIDKASRRKYYVYGMENDFESITALLAFYENNRIHPEFENIGQRLTEQHYQFIRNKWCFIQ